MTNFAPHASTIVPRAVNDVAALANRNPYKAAAVAAVVTGLAAVKYLEVVAPAVSWRNRPFDILRAKLHEWSQPEAEAPPGRPAAPALRPVD